MFKVLKKICLSLVKAKLTRPMKFPSLILSVFRNIIFQESLGGKGRLSDLKNTCKHHSLWGVQRRKDPFLGPRKGPWPMFYVLRALQTVALRKSYGNIASHTGKERKICWRIHPQAEETQGRNEKQIALRSELALPAPGFRRPPSLKVYTSIGLTRLTGLYKFRGRVCRMNGCSLRRR